MIGMIGLKWSIRRANRVAGAVIMVAIVGLLTPVLSAGQEVGPAERYVQWTASSNGTGPGGSLQVHLDGRIADGWKMYALDSSPPSRGIRVHFDALPDGFALAGDVMQSEPKEHFDPNFKIQVRYFKKSVQLSASFAVDGAVPESTYEISGYVDYQICNDDLGVCLPPTKAPFSISVLVDVACAETPSADSSCESGLSDATNLVSGSVTAAVGTNDAFVDSAELV